MKTLSNEARRILQLAKGSHEPPSIAKAVIRDRLEAKVAAVAILGSSALATKASFAGAALPVGKVMVVSLVLAGATGVGYVAKPVFLPAASPTSTPAPTRRATPSQSPSPDLSRVSAPIQVIEVADHPGSVKTASSEPTTELLSAPRQIHRSPAEATHQGNVPLAVGPRVENQPTSLLAPIEAGDNPLVQETRLIRQAHEAILKGNPTHALELLAEHERRFPVAKLQQERAAAQIVANCKLGRTEEALLQWSRFVQSWPSSPLLDRVRSSCHWPRTP